MDKRRLRLLICLILIFIITVVAFILSLFGREDNISGAVTAGLTKSGSSICMLYLPGLLFIGSIICSIIYLEKK